MINEKNATYFYVGNVANGIADEAAFEGMAAGSIAVVRALDNLNEESAISGTTPVRIVQKKADGRYVFSPVFNYGQIQYKVKQDYVGNTQQVSFWGYDGTSNTTGLGTIVSGSTYVLHVVLNHSRNTYNNAPEIKTVPYKALSTSQADLAKGLQESFIRQFSTLREPNPVIRCERVVDVTSVAAITDNATIYSLIKGSKTVRAYEKAAAADTTLTASQVDVTLGNVINVPSSDGRTFSFTATADAHVVYIGTTGYYVADAGDAAANSNAIAVAINAGTQATAVAVGAGVTTITYRPNFSAMPPIVLKSADNFTTTTQVAVTISSGNSTPVQYKIAATATNSATFELDVPWQGETGYVYEGTTSATNIGVTTTNGYWGLKFTGIEQPFSAVQGDELTNYLVAFDLYSEDFGSIVEYKATKPKMGTGTWQEMSYREHYSQFLDKDNIVSTRPRTIFRNEVVEGYGYDVVQVNVRASSITSQTTGLTFNSDFTILIATQQTPTDLANDGLATIFAV